MDLKFGSVVRVKETTRTDPGQFPLALLASEGTPVYGSKNERFNGLFIDQFPHPKEIAWANIYTDEIEGVEHQLSDKGAIALLDEVRAVKPKY